MDTAKKCAYLFFLMFIIVTLYGCASPFETMKQQFEDGEFLTAADTAVTYADDDELGPQIRHYLKTHHEIIFNQIKERANRFDITISGQESALKYWQAIIKIANDFAQVNVDIPQLGEYIFQAETEKIRIESWLADAHYTAGLTHEDSLEYRQAISHYQQVQRYKNRYEDVPERIKKLHRLAKRHVSISPFFKDSGPINRLISNSISQLLTGEKVVDDDRYLPEQLIRFSLNIPSAFNNRVLKSIKKQKSAYITATLDVENDDISHTQYYVDGFIDMYDDEDSRLHRSVRIPIDYQVDDVWSSSSVTADIYKRTYTATILVDATLYLTETNKRVDTINVEKTMTYHVYYKRNERNVPPHDHIRYSTHYPSNGDIPTHEKRHVLKTAIENAAETFSADLLSVIDKDLDPYQLSLE